MTCKTCQYIRPAKRPEMPRQGLTVCALAPAWRHFAARHTCELLKPRTEK